jgi:hypothetical protein
VPEEAEYLHTNAVYLLAFCQASSEPEWCGHDVLHASDWIARAAKLTPEKVRMERNSAQLAKLQMWTNGTSRGTSR